MKPGHAFVLGSGIAGLSVAEVLSRNGWKLTLLDTAAELGCRVEQSNLPTVPRQHFRHG